jgi:hypothetical protein
MTEVSPSPVSGIITKGSTEIDRLKEAAFKALEYLTGTKEKGDAVRCQCCNEYRPIMGKLVRPQSDSIAALEKKIRAIEQYHNSLNNNEHRQDCFYHNRKKEAKRTSTAVCRRC